MTPTSVAGFFFGSVISFTCAARGLGYQCSNWAHPHARELASILAPELAFSRASGAVDDAGRFLQKVATKNPPGELRPESIEIDTFGNRAIVKCVITQGGKNYHNIRLFVRIDANWKLLAWANEQVG